MVDRVEDITPEWLSAALTLDGVQQASFSHVTAERIGNGQTGLTYRLLADDARARGTAATLIVKLPPADPVRRGSAAFAFRQEVTFYRQVLPVVEVRAPRCLHADVSEDGSSFTLVLEDLAPARPGDSLLGAPLFQIEAALENIASLHASRWGDVTVEDLGVTDWWAAQADGVGQLQVYATEQLIAYLGDRLAPADAETLRTAAQLAPRFLRTRCAPVTIIHGDYRLENLLFDPITGDVTAVDWQTLALGPGARDVAYLITLSLSRVDRQAHQRRLVEHYHQRLLDKGVTGYDIEQCFNDFRLGQLWGAQLTSIGALNAHDREADGAADMFAGMATRTSAAIRDLDSLQLVA